MNPFSDNFDTIKSSLYPKSGWQISEKRMEADVVVQYDHLNQQYFVKMGDDEVIALTREAIEECGMGTKEYLDYLENKRRGRLIREATNKSIKKNKDYAKHLSLEMTDKMSTDDSPPATEAVATCRKFEFSSEDTLDFVSPPLSFS